METTPATKITDERIEALAIRAGIIFCDMLANGSTVEEAIAHCHNLHPTLGRLVAQAAGR